MPFLLNQDATDFAIGRPAEKLTREEVLKQIDLYEIGGDCTVIFNGNAQKTAFESNVFESFWSGVETDKDGRTFYRGKELTGLAKKFPEGIKKLYDNVNDLFELRIAYGRQHKYKIFLSMRMNDIHCVSDFDNILVSDFWREHQDCLITDYSEDWCYNAFDYAKKEIYDRHLALLREYLTRFDPDGFELDWMRSPYYFKPGYETENAEILTQFMRDARKLANECAARNGHPLELIVRIPSRPEDARRMGFDVFSWAKEKLADRIIVTSYWGETDHDIPLELWRMLLGDEIKITAGLELLCRCTPFQKGDFYNDAAVIFGFASSFYYRGSDDIYLYNHMDDTGTATGMKDMAEFRLVLKTLGKRDQVERQKRRHIVTHTNSLARAIGYAIDPVLPLEMCDNNRFVRLNIGGAVKNKNAKLVIACDNGAPSEVRCGGVICHKTDEKFTGKLPSDVTNPVIYQIPDEGLKEGDNVLSFRGNNNKLVWCEIDLEES